MAKRWKCTEKQYRRSLPHRRSPWWGGAPKSYRKQFNKDFSAHNRMELWRVVNEWAEDDCFLYWHKHSARWDYW